MITAIYKRRFQDGQDGQNGQTGQTGEAGQDGQTGQTGEAGQDGQDGQNGQNGHNGEDGASGIGVEINGTFSGTQSFSLIDINRARDMITLTAEYVLAEEINLTAFSVHVWARLFRPVEGTNSYAKVWYNATRNKLVAGRSNIWYGGDEASIEGIDYLIWRSRDFLYLYSRHVREWKITIL